MRLRLPEGIKSLASFLVSYSHPLSVIQRSGARKDLTGVIAGTCVIVVIVLFLVCNKTYYTYILR